MSIMPRLEALGEIPPIEFQLPHDIVTSSCFHRSSHFLPEGHSAIIGTKGWITKTTNPKGEEFTLPENHAIYHTHIGEYEPGALIHLCGRTWATILQREELEVQEHTLGQLTWEHPGYNYYVELFKKQPTAT